MKCSQSADLFRSLMQTRRTFLGGGLGVATGWLGLAGTSARNRHKKKKRRHKPKKDTPRFNQFGCVDVGGACFGNDANCCSGICAGIGKSSTCLAHDELGCAADDETCVESVPCGATGVCYRTTGKAGFCGDFRVCNCAPCQRDADCELDFGPGAACVTCDSDCQGVNRSQGTACVPAAD